MSEGHVIRFWPRPFDEIELALGEGVRRVVNAIKTGSNGALSGGSFISADKYSITQNCVGALAEWVMSKVLKVEWNPVRDDFDRHQDVGGYEVRGLIEDDGELKIRPDKEKLYLSKKYALVSVRSVVEYRVIGWITGAEVETMRLEKEDRGGRNLPAWFVGQDLLHEFDPSLFDEFKPAKLKSAVNRMNQDLATMRERKKHERQEGNREGDVRQAGPGGVPDLHVQDPGPG